MYYYKYVCMYVCMCITCMRSKLYVCMYLCMCYLDGAGYAVWGVMESYQRIAHGSRAAS